ncbi:MAG: hypothetical protein AB7S38_23380 [Vulcanimicrobiota bacterium]
MQALAVQERLFAAHLPTLCQTADFRPAAPHSRPVRPGERWARLRTSDRLHFALRTTAEPSEGERRAYQDKQHDLQNRLDRQHDTYHWNTKGKNTLIHLMRKLNKKVAKYFRNFRKAMKDLAKAIASQADQGALMAAIRGVLTTASSLAGMLRPMVSLMTGMNRLNQGIHKASTLVDPSELQDKSGLNFLTPELQMAAATRDPNALSPIGHLEVGRFAFDWTKGLVTEGASSIGAALQLIRSTIEKRREKGQHFPEAETSMKAIERQHASLASALQELNQSDSFS